MKDFRDIEMKVGDTVAFIETGQSPDLKEGIVKTVKPNSVGIEFEDWDGKRITTKRANAKISIIKKRNPLKEIIEEVKDNG